MISEIPATISLHFSNLSGPISIRACHLFPAYGVLPLVLGANKKLLLRPSGQNIRFYRMTVRPNSNSGTSNFSMVLAFTIGIWAVGVIAHLMFQFLFGSWYDGLVYTLGFGTAVWMFVLTFATATISALLLEGQIKRLATVNRCILHMAVGIIVIPLMISIILGILKPGLSGVQLGTIAGLETFFSIVIRSPILLVKIGRAHV